MNRLLSVFVFLAAAGPILHAQALLPAQDWTSNDGKKLRAELLRFDGENAMLRMANGNVFSIPDSRFDRESQAILLNARLYSGFRETYSAVLNANFFYSNQLAEDDWVGRCYGYIGADSEKVWLRLAIYLTGEQLSRSNALVIEGEGAPARIEYDIDDIEYGESKRRRYEHVDISLTKVPEAVTLFESPDDLMFFFENSEGAKIPHPLSEEERLGLNELAVHFRKAKNLAEDKALWTAFRVRKPGETDDPNSAPAAVDPLEKFRDPDQPPLLATRPWTNPLDQTVEAEVAGFNGQNVVLRKTDGAILEVPLGGFLPADQQLLVAKRLEDFEVDFHPVDRKLRWIIPRGSDPWSRRTLMVAVDPQTKKPRLFLQQFSRRFGGQRLKSVMIRGDHMDDELRIAMDDQLDQFGGDSTWSWVELTGETLETALTLTEAREIYFRLYDQEDKTDTGSFRGGEVRSSKEAIALYHWLNLVEVQLPEPPRDTF